MSSSVDFDDLPLVEGFVAGAAAWVVGYVLTAVVVLARLENSELGELSNGVDGGGSSIDLVGWVFFNGHFVETVVEADFLGFGGSSTTSFVGGDGFTPLLYLVPVALLVGSGLAVGRSRGVTDTTEGAVTGVLVVPPYLALSAIGAVLFRVSNEALGASFGGRPELLPAVLLAGVVFPSVFGALGGIIAANTGPGSE
ncbi:transporter [Haloplanus salilacus]|uniref:transporter n=1 Tax=Haloplanus salilacus TaxID=2949994 RepID=UPI0030D540F7